MVSPGKILLAPVAMVLAGMASYFVSTAHFKITPVQFEPPPEQSEATPVQSEAAPVQSKDTPVQSEAAPVQPKGTPVQASDFHAIVEPSGAVVLCVSSGEIQFPDRCVGTGRLLMVQPIKEAEVASIAAPGVVAMENESPQNPDCALSRAKWDSTSEVTTPMGRKLRKIPSEAVVQQLNKIYQANLTAEDISAFGLDLDNDGREDIVYAADNVSRIAKLNDKTGQPYPYFVQGGIFNGRAPAYPSIFLHDTGDYSGGTDAISQIVLKGIVPVAPNSGALAILARTGSGIDGGQSLVWLGGGQLQRITSFEFRCN
jgi:hypothetical protein